MKKIFLIILIIIQFLFARFPSALGYNGAVVSSNQYATNIGLDILKKGGNAIDAAIAVGLELEVPVKKISDGLAGFCGVERRLQRIGEKSGILIIDDYGHHPTEIRATLSAVKQAWGRRLIVLFQPHRFSRTRDLMEDL